MLDLSIIIINHNTRELTRQAVESILNGNVSCSYEIIVADNSDKADEKFTYSDDRVKILPDVENKGFANGCNVGAAIAEGRYYLFLNSDTIMQDDTLNASLAMMEADPQIGALGVKLIMGDGNLDQACRRGFPTPWNSFCYFAKLDRLFKKAKAFNGYHPNYLPEDKASSIDLICGAYMMMPKSIFEDLGGWDETFFMYGEDIDLCYKVKQAGYKVVYDPRVTCTHLKGKSGRASDNPFVQYHFYNAMLIFYDRYYSKKYANILAGAIKLLLRRKVNHYKKLLAES